jgi:predicted membrane protein
MEHVEQAGQVETAIEEENGTERAHERYGWMILSASALLGIVAAIVTTIPPLYVFSSSLYQDVYPLMGALGTALVGFNVLALIVAVVPYRRYERWAWFALWLLPAQWVSQFVLLPQVSYLILAVLTAVGLVLPFRRFFSGSRKESTPVR